MRMAVVVDVALRTDRGHVRMQRRRMLANACQRQEQDRDRRDQGDENVQRSLSPAKQHDRTVIRQCGFGQGRPLKYPLQGDRYPLMTEHRHDTHPEIVKRLRRAEGHLKSVIVMIEGGRPCLDIAQQLQAVEKAITNAKRTLIQDHLDHCLDDAVGPLGGEQRRTIDEFKTIAKYL
jgi:DNA-binding FrmR family transcriptional regulator